MQSEKESPRVFTRRVGLNLRIFWIAFTLLFECRLASDSSPHIPPQRTIVDRNGRVWDAAWDPRTARPYYVERSSGATSWAVDAAPLQWSDTTRAPHLPRAGHAVETAPARQWAPGPHVAQPRQLTRQYPPPQEPQLQSSRSPDTSAQTRALPQQQPKQDLSTHQLHQRGQHYVPETQSHYPLQAPRQYTKHEAARPQNHARDQHEQHLPRDRHASPAETHPSVAAPRNLGSSESPPKSAQRSSTASVVEAKVQPPSESAIQADDGIPSLANARETSVHNEEASTAPESSNDEMKSKDVEAAPVDVNKTATSTNAAGKEISHVQASKDDLIESKRLLAPSSSLFGWLFRLTQYIFTRKRQKASRPQRQKWRIFYYLQPFKRSSLQSASHAIVDVRNASSKKKRNPIISAPKPSAKRIAGTPNSTTPTERKRKRSFLFSWRLLALKRTRTKQSPQPDVRNQSTREVSGSASTAVPQKKDASPEDPEESKHKEFDTASCVEHVLPQADIRSNETLQQAESMDFSSERSEMQQKIDMLQHERDVALDESARQLKLLAELRQISERASQEAALLRERIADSDAEVENLRRNFARCEVALTAAAISARQKESSADLQLNETHESTPENPVDAVLLSPTISSPSPTISSPSPTISSPSPTISSPGTDLRLRDEASQEHILSIRIRRTLRVFIGASALGAALALVLRFGPLYLADGRQLPFDE